MKDYPQKAVKTLSSKWFGKNVHQSYFLLTIAQAISALENLDKLKKQLYYGRDVGDVDFSDTAIARAYGDASCDQYLQDQRARDVLHGVIGKATESGELLEALMGLIKEDGLIDFDKIDKANMLEEIGDGFWYDGVLCNIFEFSFEDAQKVNIEKLQSKFGRYAGGFTCEAAIERDLKKEREILEKGVDETENKK